eukprot:5247242-Pyramimonas_sp.AAC.2
MEPNVARMRRVNPDQVVTNHTYWEDETSTVAYQKARTEVSTFELSPEMHILPEQEIQNRKKLERSIDHNVCQKCSEKIRWKFECVPRTLPEVLGYPDTMLGYLTQC